jgi:WD40 repeat protein
VPESLVVVDHRSAGVASVFEVAIGARADGKFRVEVVRSSAGEASASVALDVAGLAGQRVQVQQAVLASAIPTRRVLSAGEQVIQRVGKELFTALLGTGEVAGRYRASQAMAAERSQHLRLVVRIDSPQLAGLPWEAMYDEALGVYVCRSEQLVRHVSVPAMPGPLQVRPPLRILGVVSSPRGLPTLEIDKEREQLERALADTIRAGLVQVRWAPSATWSCLHDELMDRSWHVIHYIGHGDFDPDLDEGILALEREQDGRPDRVAAHKIVDLLRQADPMPRLVVLNSCSGGVVGTCDLFSGTAASLVRGGVNAVAAMQYEVSDLAAVAFARGLYTRLVRGGGVDQATTSGRIAILGVGGSTMEWVTPVLYLRGDQARLFAVPSTQTPHWPHTPTLTSVGHSDPDRSQGIAGAQSTEANASMSESSAPTSPRETTLATGSPTDPAMPTLYRLIHVFTPTNPKPGLVLPADFRESLTRSPSRWCGVAFSPDGALLATGGSHATIGIWRVNSGEQVNVLTGYTESLLKVIFSPDGTLLSASSTDYTARIWRVDTGEQVLCVPCRAGVGVRAAFSPDSMLFATASSSDDTARIWRTDTGQQVHALTGHTGWLSGMAFSPDGTLLATTSSDTTVRIWQMDTGQQVHVLKGHAAWASRAIFSPDGALLATVGGDRTARIWWVKTGRQVHVLTGHTSRVEGVIFSPDGTLLATSSDTTVRIWRMDTGQQVHAREGYDWLSEVVFSPEGPLMASISNNTVRIWRVDTGKQVHVLPHTRSVLGMAFSPDGILLSTASLDGNTRIWHMAADVS